MQLKWAGDREIWVVKGKDDQGRPWRLPVYAAPLVDELGNRYLEVQPAVAYSGAMTEAYMGVVRGLAHTVTPLGFTVREAEFAEVAEPVRGVTPELHLVWPEGDAYVPARRLEPEEGEAEPEIPGELLAMAAKNAPILRPWMIKAAWRGILSAMRELLVERRRSVDLHWFIVHPVPFRSNWKELWHELGEPVGENVLKRGAYLAMNRGEQGWYVEWDLEIEPAQVLLRAFDAHERSALAALGEEGYGVRIDHLIGQRQSAYMRLLQHWRLRLGRAVGHLLVGLNSTFVLRGKTPGPRLARKLQGALTGPEQGNETAAK